VSPFDSDFTSDSQETSLNPAERGTPFGRFRLLDRVGAGDVAEVFRALVVGVQGFERRVAIKVMRGDVAEAEVGSLFAEEARVSALLDCAGVVQVYEFGVIEAAPYIAMEYVAGRNLADVLVALRAVGERLPPALAVFVAMELAGALVHAHESEDNRGLALRIIHGGIHPANVMLGREGAVKLLDFGVWPVLTDPHSPVSRGGRRVPPHAAYLSPEQARGYEIDERSDLFSLGVVLWEMLTGRPLFTGKSDRQTLKNVQNAPISAPSSLAPGVPPSLDAIVQNMLAREPARRYRSASAVLRDLEEVALTLPRRHGDMATLLDRLGGSPRETNSGRILVSDSGVTVRPTTPIPRVAFQLPAPRPHPGERAPTTKMMGDTTLAAILAREPRRRNTARARLRADPKSLMVGVGSLVAGLIIAAALLTGRSKPVAHPTETTKPVAAPTAVAPSPAPVAATPPAPAVAAPDAGPPAAVVAVPPPEELPAPPPKATPRRRHAPSAHRSGGQVRHDLDDHRPNPF
jgi:serine/threonine protein kinase